VDETLETEWQWFRRAIRDSLLRPSRFAASLAREHYGIAGVLVAILAGIALSISVDALVLSAKGFSVLDYTTRVFIDALLLGVRLAIVAALVSGAVGLFMRLVRHAELSMDQAFTALTFALTPLFLTPILAAALAIVPQTLPIVGILAGAVLLGFAAWRWTRTREPAPALASVPAGLDPELERRLDDELRRFDA